MLFWNRQNKNAVFDLQNNYVLRLKIRLCYNISNIFF